MKMNRNLYRVFLVLSFLALNALILFAISSVWSYLNTGADRASILHLQEEKSSTYLPKITWDISTIKGRPIEKQTLSEIERDYLRAWQVRNIAYETNDTYGLTDYYTDSIRVKISKIIKLNTTNGVTLKTTTLEHHPKLDFYSADGKMVVFTDYDVRQYEEVYQHTIQLSKSQRIISFKVILLLEDGFWRIRQFVEIPTEPKKIAELTPKKITFSKLKGLNYYPQETPWDMFGKKFKASIINNDFKEITKLGLNTIRVFVPYEDFGKAAIDINKIAKLKKTLDLAEKNNLKVVITLFDFYGNYDIKDWTLTNHHAEYIVSHFKNHPALLAWDVKNEPDLDFESRGKDKVLSWLQQTIASIKQFDSQHQVTIGWSSPEAAINLNDEVDFVSFHFYKKVSEFSEAYADLKKEVPNKPLMLQEFGYSSYDGVWNVFTGSEEDQKEYIEAMLQILDEKKIPYLFWTLHDFEEIPTSVVGRLPWKKAQQKHFGILDSNLKPKPVYSIFKERK